MKNAKLWIEELNQRQEGIPKAANEQIQIWILAMSGDLEHMMLLFHNSNSYDGDYLLVLA